VISLCVLNAISLLADTGVQSWPFHILHNIYAYCSLGYVVAHCSTSVPRTRLSTFSSIPSSGWRPPRSHTLMKLKKGLCQDATKGHFYQSSRLQLAEGGRGGFLTNFMVAGSRGKAAEACGVWWLWRSCTKVHGLSQALLKWSSRTSYARTRKTPWYTRL
jgi:hypothetical protein